MRRCTAHPVSQVVKMLDAVVRRCLKKHQLAMKMLDAGVCRCLQKHQLAPIVWLKYKARNCLIGS